MSAVAVTPANRPAPAASEAVPAAIAFHYTQTDNFVALLHQLGASLLVSTYRANKLLVVRPAGNGLFTLVRSFDRRWAWPRTAAGWRWARAPRWLLAHAGIGTNRIQRSLEQIRAWSSDAGAPPDQLAIVEKYGRLLVRLESGLVEPSGQMYFDFGEDSTILEHGRPRLKNGLSSVASTKKTAPTMKPSAPIARHCSVAARTPTSVSISRTSSVPLATKPKRVSGIARPWN